MAIVAVGIKIAFVLLVIPFIINLLTSFLGIVFYIIAQGFFLIIDTLQDIFRKLAGLDSVWIGASGDVQSDNVILGIIGNPIVIEALIAMTLFAVALLIIATIVQMIRVEYTTEGAKNTKGNILGLSLKAIVMFIMIPVLCISGIYISNQLLKAVDAATSRGGSSSIAGAVFLAGASEANCVRYTTLNPGEKNDFASGDVFLLGGRNKLWKAADNDSDLFTLFGLQAELSQKNQLRLASRIDDYFALSKEDAKIIKELDGGEAFVTLKPNLNGDTLLHYNNTRAVKYFYNFNQMNYIIMYAASCFTIVILFKVAFGLIMRMYKVAALFIISPGVIALQPIDGGNAFKSWRKNFMGSVLSAYGVVVALNLFFLLVGVVTNIYIFDPNNFLNITPNYYMQALFVIVGCLMIEKLSSDIASYIGGEDSLKDGTEMAGKVGKTVAKVGKFAGGAAIIGKGIAGSISAKYNADRATGVTKDKISAKVDEIAHEAETIGAKKSGGTPISNKEKRLLNKYNRLTKKANYLSRDDVKDKYAFRAARGSRDAFRGNETLGDMFRGSGVGSFLNSISGDYTDLGSSGKALDEKVPSNIMKMAEKAKDGKGMTIAKGILNPFHYIDKAGKNLENSITGAERTKAVLDDHDKRAALIQQVQSFQAQNGEQSQLNVKNQESNDLLSNILKEIKAVALGSGTAADKQTAIGNLSNNYNDILKRNGGLYKEKDKKRLNKVLHGIDEGVRNDNMGEVVSAANTDISDSKFKAWSTIKRNSALKNNKIRKDIEQNIKDITDAVNKLYNEGAKEAGEAVLQAIGKVSATSYVSSDTKIEKIIDKHKKELDAAVEKEAEKAVSDQMASLLKKISKKK